MKRTVVAVALMSIGLTAAHAQEMVVKLGGAAPLTGNQSHLGKDLENGTRLAIEEANAKGIKLEQATNGLPIPLHPGAERFYREVGIIK